MTRTAPHKPSAATLSQTAPREDSQLSSATKKSQKSSAQKKENSTAKLGSAATKEMNKNTKSVKSPSKKATTPSLSEVLDDASILAMSPDDYMNDVQLAYFRNKLVTMRDSMLASAGATTEHLREENVITPDPTDRATIEEEHALELRTRDRERKLLKKIEQSIARIDAGEYGYCEETGEPIGLGRLLARPTASLSLEAQERREQRQKLYGD